MSVRIVMLNAEAAQRAAEASASAELQASLEAHLRQVNGQLAGTGNSNA